MKLGSPGVSSRLILRPDHSNELSASEIDIWRDCSSGSESETVVPSTTEPSRLVAPAEQEGLVQRGLPAAAVADEGDVADAVGRLVHAATPLLGEGAM